MINNIKVIKDKVTDKAKSKKGIKFSYIKLIIGVFSLIALVLVVVQLNSKVIRPNIVIDGNIYLPPHLLYYAQYNQRLFVVIYLKDNPQMPLAVMEEPYNVQIDDTTSKNGYTRYFYVSEEKLNFMDLAQAHDFLADLAAKKSTKIMLKVRIDHDLRGGMDSYNDLISDKLMFVLGDRNISIDIVKRIGN